MYKINIKSTIKLFAYTHGIGYNVIKEFKNVYELLEFNKKELNNKFILSEVLQAMEHMQQMGHDTAEFGVNGYFTISYNESDYVQNYF